MLHFLRTHQRILFLFLTIIIVISFVFFGTYGTFMNPPTEEDTTVYKTESGQEISRGQLERMKRFLASDNEVIPTQHTFPNYLNTGFLQKDVISTGAITHIALKNWDRVSEELSHKLQLEKEWRPFAHTESKEVSAQNVWKIFAPTIPENLSNLKKAQTKEELLEAHFALMSAEKAFPEPYLAQILSWQQQKEPGLASEVEQYRGHLSLFGYKDPVDWMGMKLYDNVVCTYLELAARAEKKGIKVSDQEIRHYLRSASEEGRQKARVMQLDFLQLDSPEGFYGQQLQILRLSEEEAMDVCRPLLLAGKLIAEERDILTAGESSHREVALLEVSFVDIYEMDPSLQFTKADDLYLFEKYLEKVGEAPGHLKFASLETVEKRAPELVQKTFHVEMKEVTAADVSLKDVWAYQLSDAGWKKLQTKFKELLDAKTSDERSEKLDFLSADMRHKVDLFARQQIFKENKDSVESLLDAAKAHVCSLTLPMKGAPHDTPFKGLKESAELYSKLSAQDCVKKISFDGETFYRVTVLHKEGPQVLSFKEAKTKLGQPDAKKYASLVNTLVAEAKKAGIEKNSQESAGDFAARVRFLKHLQQEKLRFEEANVLQKAQDLVKTNDLWSLKKRKSSLLNALKEGAVVGEVTSTSDHLVIAFPGDSSKEETEAKIEKLVHNKHMKEAALKLFRGL